MTAGRASSCHLPGFAGGAPTSRARLALWSLFVPRRHLCRRWVTEGRAGVDSRESSFSFKRGFLVGFSMAF